METGKGRMEVKIEGPAAEGGRIEITAFAEIAQAINQGLRRVAFNVFKGTKRKAGGRYPEEMCRVAISGLQGGCVRMALDVLPPKQLHLYADVDTPLVQFVDGVDSLPKWGGVLPSGFDLAVVSALDRVATTLSKREISRITFSKPSNGKTHTATIEPKSHPVLSSFLRRAQDAGAKVEGKFYQVNLRNQTATLETYERETIPCQFEEATEMQVIEGLTQDVRVYGKAEKDTATQRIVRLDVNIVERLPKRAQKMRLRLKGMEGRDPILALAGLGREIWQDVAPDDYVRSLREGWE